MRTLNTDKSWIRYGKENPYYGVLTNDIYLQKNITEEALQAFFLSGVQDVDNLFQIIHDHIDRSFRPNTVLDFGCGTGRLVIPLAKRAKKVIGLDISKDILDIARLNTKKKNLDNVQFYLSDDNLTKISDQKFDFINSYIVFQHINVHRGEKLIQLLLKRLNSNGICALHITYYRDFSKFTKAVNFFIIRVPFLYNFLSFFMKKKTKGLPLMQMNAYDLNKIFYILQKEGINNSHMVFTNHGNTLGVQLICQKK